MFVCLNRKTEAQSWLGRLHKQPRGQRRRPGAQLGRQRPVGLRRGRPEARLTEPSRGLAWMGCTGGSSLAQAGDQEGRNQTGPKQSLQQASSLCPGSALQPLTSSQGTQAWGPAPVSCLYFAHQHKPVAKGLLISPFCCRGDSGGLMRASSPGQQREGRGPAFSEAQTAGQPSLGFLDPKVPKALLPFHPRAARPLNPQTENWRSLYEFFGV